MYLYMCICISVHVCLTQLIAAVIYILACHIPNFSRSYKGLFILMQIYMRYPPSHIGYIVYLFPGGKNLVGMVTVPICAWHHSKDISGNHTRIDNIQNSSLHRV